jgi:hypothetical protein
MDWSKYSALKSDSKASMAKEEKKAAVKYKKADDIPEGKKVGDEKEAAQEAVYLSQKRFSPDSGEALDDDKIEMSLPALEADKARYDAQAARAKAQSDGLKAIIADYKKKV